MLGTREMDDGTPTFRRIVGPEKGRGDLPDHRHLLARWYVQAGSWERLADRLPLDLHPSVLMKEVQDGNRLAEDTQQAILDHAGEVVSDHQAAEEAVIAAIQAIERVRKETGKNFERTVNVLHKKADQLLTDR